MICFCLLQFYDLLRRQAEHFSSTSQVSLSRSFCRSVSLLSTKLPVHLCGPVWGSSLGARRFPFFPASSGAAQPGAEARAEQGGTTQPPTDSQNTEISESSTTAFYLTHARKKYTSHAKKLHGSQKLALTVKCVHVLVCKACVHV